jgi:hypothetical protein
MILRCEVMTLIQIKSIRQQSIAAIRSLRNRSERRSNAKQLGLAGAVAVCLEG